VTLLFDSRVLWHSLTFTVRFLKVLLSHFEYRANLSTPSATLSNASNQEARRVAVPEFASWIPRRPPPLFPNATLLIAVEKLYIEEKREANTNSPIQATYILMWGPTRLLHGSIVAWLQVLTSWSSGPVCRPFYLGKLLDATIWSCTIGCRTQLLHDGSAPHRTLPCNNRVPTEIVCSMRWGPVSIWMCYTFLGALLSFQMDDLLSIQLIVACSSSYQLSLKSKFCNCYTRFISLSRWSTQLQLNCSMPVAPDIWTSGVAFVLMLL